MQLSFGPNGVTLRKKYIYVWHNTNEKKKSHYPYTIFPFTKDKDKDCLIAVVYVTNKSF